MFGNLLKVIGAVFGGAFAIAALLSLMFGLTWLGIEWRGFFGPKRAAVEREIFRETRSYDEGMVQQLSRYRLQYVRAESQAEKDAIASTVRTMFAEYDPSKLPNSDLRNFLNEVNR